MPFDTSKTDITSEFESQRSNNHSISFLMNILSLAEINYKSPFRTLNVKCRP